MVNTVEPHTRIIHAIAVKLIGRGLVDADFGQWAGFTGKELDQFIAMGFKLGFGGALTFERANQLRLLATQLPLDALVLETDSPDIPPHWLYVTAEDRAKGTPQERNTPSEIPRIAQVLADLRGIDLDEVQQATSANVKAALGLR